MNIKNIAAFLFLLLLTQGFAQNRDFKIANEPPPKLQPLVEIKGGYFFFSSERMRKIYDQGGLDIQGSGRYPIYKWLQLYGSVEYAERHGKALGGDQKTRIWLVPLSLGLQPVVSICKTVQYYLTLGPRYFFVHAHNDSSLVDKNINVNGLGGFANTGFYFFPTRHLVVDLFGEYSYVRLQCHPSKRDVFSTKTQLGGFTFGVGLGYIF